VQIPAPLEQRTSATKPELNPPLKLRDVYVLSDSPTLCVRSSPLSSSSGRNGNPASKLAHPCVACALLDTAVLACKFPNAGDLASALDSHHPTPGLRQPLRRAAFQAPSSKGGVPEREGATASSSGLRACLKISAGKRCDGHGLEGNYQHLRRG
jgi:hypothetical protein